MAARHPLPASPKHATTTSRFGRRAIPQHPSLAERLAPCAALAPCLYILVLAFPMAWDVGLAVFAFACVGFIGIGVPRRFSWSVFAAPFALFLSSMALSTLMSVDPLRSLRLSTQFIPGLLLFFAVTEYFRDLQDARRLYLAFSVVSLGLATTLLWTATRHPELDTRLLLQGIGNPILIVPNDTAMFAVMAPLSFALLNDTRLRWSRVFAFMSLVACLIVIVVLESRTALLTMLASLCSAVALLQRRVKAVILCSSSILVSALAVDWALGFPFVTKSLNQWSGSGRLDLWRAGWAMFLDAPVIGQGPHTFGILHSSYMQALHIPFPVNSPWTHNLYLETLAEQGLVGCGALGFLLMQGLLKGWRLRSSTTRETCVYGTAALAALTGFCVAAVLEISFLRQWAVVVLLALLGVTAQLWAREQQEGNRWPR